ncbi:Networked 2D [Hibiscus trionum]|uniref:Networked 2D n=1 Tax=Hibiscus trionum TaxID=183268 RepID=A0A9W7IWE0_HIBTR|nr:Networked 2D [Hibiscus trionum]
MLQKAASNAYSWWWASHVRTKQSKWLEQNLNDTEEKVTDMLKIIDHDGDTFAQRAEMYYSKRAELVSLIEEIFRSYRSMAGRFDHLSKNLQSANRTIASIFPDRVPYEMDDDDDDDPFQHDKPVTPKVKSLKEDFRGTPKKAVGFQASGLKKDEALKEIDKLQKEMLALQTEREFMKSSYEYGYKKFNEIENQITAKQKRVCLLQDEFGIESVIDDNEGRTIMVNQALKSCQESLDKLKEKHEQSTKEVREESRRIRLVSSKFEALRNKFNSLQMEKAKRVSSIAELDSMVYDIDNEANRGEDMEASDQQEKPKRIPSIAELDIEDDMREDMEPSDKQVSSTMELDNMDYEIEYEEKESLAIEALRKEIEEKLQLGSKESLTMKQLVEKIDVLVKRVIRLETAVVSEKAQIKRLKSEADELQEQVRSLEEDKTALIEDSAAMEKRINELEAELSRVKDHVKTVVDQNNSLKANLTEAICNVNHLSVKLQEVEGTEFSQDVTTGSGAVSPKGTEERELELLRSALKGTGTGFERKDKDVSAEGENIVDSDSSYKLDGDSGKDLELVGENTADKKDLSVDGDPENGPESVGENKADKKHSSVDSDSSYMHDGDSEKGPEPVGEDEADKKHLSETAGSVPDTEVGEAEANEEEEPNWKQLYLGGMDDGEKILLDEYSHALQNYKEVRKKLNEVDKKHRDAFFQLASQIQELKNVVALRDQVIQSLRQKLSSLEENKDVNLVEHEAIRLSTGQESDLTEAIQQWPIDQECAEKMGDPESGPHGILTVEDEIRSEIDDLLEENLEFWLRFSTSVHQIKKYQTSVKDLKVELWKLRGRKNQEGGRQQYMKSAARPIYFHLREIKTELTLWLENTEVLKDEVQDRHLTLCNFQDEIARVTNARDHRGETGISVYQAAKFQGEVLIMNQEINKVGEQLKSGFTSAGQLKQEIQRIMADLEKELWSSPSTTSQSQSRSWRPRIPLQSFLFGLKLRSKKKKKKSLQKQLSYIIEPKGPSE